MANFFFLLPIKIPVVSKNLWALPINIGVLVVCPAALKYNWSDEAAKWRSDLKVTIINGRGNFRFPEAGEIVITNYDILPQEFSISSQMR